MRTLDALPREGHLLWRISVPPALGWRVGEVLAPLDAHIAYDWAGGLVWASVLETDPQAVGAAIRAIARELGGHAVLVRAPPALRASLLPAARTDAGADQGHKALHRRLKAAFDPHGILNPGVDLAGEL
jgi:glycolate oxidase FAD binding subunit